MAPRTFGARLRRALTGDPGSPLVVIGNFEVEHRWARGWTGLPRLAADEGTAVVNRMDELALPLGLADDTVVLKGEPDPDFLADLEAFGVEIPRTVVVRNRAERSVTEDALDDDAALGLLSTLPGHGHRLLAHGVSDLEEELAARTGIGLAGPPPDVVRRVNSKVYSRRLADEHGLPQPHGWACTTLDEWERVVDDAAADLEHGPLVVKEAFGVSGKGLAVVEDERRLRRLGRLVARRALASGDRVAFCVERWHDKARDFNYQVTVGRDGSVELDFVKEAVTENGTHRGHRFPARLDAAHLSTIEKTAEVVGGALAADGYAGVVGVDAITTTDGELFPVLEINARHNMSTYQLPLQEQLVRDDVVIRARHFPTSSTTPVAYGAIRTALDDVRYDPRRGTGVVVQAFATVNAAFAVEQDHAGAPKNGRLYVLLVGDDETDLDRIDRAADAALARLGAPT